MAASGSVVASRKTKFLVLPIYHHWEGSEKTFSEMKRPTHTYDVQERRTARRPLGLSLATDPQSLATLYRRVVTSNEQGPSHFLHSHYSMSSTMASSPDFQSILNAALSDYATQTGIDLATHPFAQTVRNCHDADAVFNLLQDRANQFHAYRDGNRKLIDYLKPVVQVLHQVSAILGEAATSVSTAIQLVMLGTHFFSPPTPGSISTNKGNPRWRRCPPRRTNLLCAPRLRPCNVFILQASLAVSSSYDALLDLFECVGNFLNRLRIYSGIPFSPSMTGIITKILVEVLSVLSLATKQIKQGRLSKSFLIIHIFRY